MNRCRCHKPAGRDINEAPGYGRRRSPEPTPRINPVFRIDDSIEYCDLKHRRCLWDLSLGRRGGP
jgi:hypothetical protein